MWRARLRDGNRKPGRSHLLTALNSLRIVFANEDLTEDDPAIFIDRDGVINVRRPNDYVLDWPQFVFVPGIRAALKKIARLGLPLILISNQAAVGKGLLKISDLETLTARLYESLAHDGILLHSAYYCPHRSEDLCTCRKPRPGLLLRAASDFKINLSRSIFIGDSETDVQAARVAGCRPILFGPGLQTRNSPAAWMTGLDVAPTAQGLLPAAVHCLRHGTQPLRDD